MLHHQAVNSHSENLPQCDKITGHYHMNLSVKTPRQMKEGILRLTESKSISRNCFA